MRKLFKTIRELVERRHRSDPTTIDTHDHLPRQSVSAFCFLRFIVPAILHPHLFGLSPGQPQVQTLIFSVLIHSLFQAFRASQCSEA